MFSDYEPKNMLLRSNNFSSILKKCFFIKKSHSIAAKKQLLEIKEKFLDLTNIFLDS